MFKFGNDFTRLYLWSEASQEQLKKFELHYQVDEQPEQMISDSSFPYEFSVPLDVQDKLLKIRIEGELQIGETFSKQFGFQL